MHIKSVGASFIHAHMLNVESRKYFNRAYLSSGCVSGYHLRTDTHLEMLQECLQTNDTGNELVEFLKTASSFQLSSCNFLPWVIYIESLSAPHPFITQTSDEIYKSDNPPIMDAMFSIASQVRTPKNHSSFSIYPINFALVLLVSCRNQYSLPRNCLSGQSHRFQKLELSRIVRYHKTNMPNSSIPK